MTHFSDKQIIIKAWKSLKIISYSDQFGFWIFWKNQNQAGVLVESKISYIGNAIEVLPIVEEG